MDNIDSGKNEEATQLSGPSQITSSIITNNNNHSNQLINNPSTSSIFIMFKLQSEPEYIFISYCGATKKKNEKIHKNDLSFECCHGFRLHRGVIKTNRHGRIGSQFRNQKK